MTEASWQRKRLRYLASLNPSKSEIADVDRATEVSFIPMEAVSENGGLDLTQNRPIAEVESGYTFLREGDVAYAKITPCFENGKAAVMVGLTEGIAFGTTELTVLRAKPGIAHGRFLFWLIKSPEFSFAGEATMTGAGGQKRVPDAFTRNFEIACPPLPEQQVIADFLDRETGKIDALVKEQRRLIALLKEKRQAVISHAVTKGLDPTAPLKPSGIDWLGDIPAHWEVRSINSLSNKITNGYVGPTRGILVAEGVKYLQSLHIKRNEIRFEKPYFVTKEWSNHHAKSILQAEDVLIVQTGDIGQVAVVTDEFVGCNCHALIIVAPDQTQASGRWITWVLASNYGQHVLHSIKTGALHPHLNCGNVKFVVCPVPPLEEQEFLIAHLEKTLARFDDLEAEATRAIALLQERRAALISAAVTGKIDVRDTLSNDEEAA